MFFVVYFLPVLVLVSASLSLAHPGDVMDCVFIAFLYLYKTKRWGGGEEG